MRRTTLVVWVVVLFGALGVVACGGDDGGGGDAGEDAGTDTAAGWGDVGINNAYAPDEFTVIVELVGAPPVADAGNSAIYTLSSGFGALDVLSVAYDGSAQTATISTPRQKLGVTYTVTVTPPPDGVAPLSYDFPSADAVTFWTLNVTSTPEDAFYEQKTTHRVAVSEKTVVYVENGYSLSGGSDDTVGEVIQAFDDPIFPGETGLLAEAPDRDGNGRIVVVGIDGGSFYGAYFDRMNAYTEEEAVSLGGHSNEMEMIVLNVMVGYSTDDYIETLAHEFEHLLYFERHGDAEHWLYHDEGLAEVAVQAVFGEYSGGLYNYFGDDQRLISRGISLVDWNWTTNANYGVAFLFWSYVAGQLGGIGSVSDIFDMDTGSPDEVNDFLLERLGRGFGEVQLDQMIATHVQAETGIYGYEGFLDFAGRKPPTAEEGDSSYDLNPFGGTYFFVEPAVVDYPGTQGAHIVYAGVNGDDAVDYEAPFDVDGGVLVVLDDNMDYTMDTDGDLFPFEHSGPDLPATGGKKGLRSRPAAAAGTWIDPPPHDPKNPGPFDAWRDAALERLGWR